MYTTSVGQSLLVLVGSVASSHGLAANSPRGHVSSAAAAAPETAAGACKANPEVLIESGVQ